MGLHVVKRSPCTMSSGTLGMVYARVVRHSLRAGRVRRLRLQHNRSGTPPV